MSKATQKSNLKQLNQFIERTPPERLSRNLRNLLLEHLAIQKDGYTFDLEDLLVDILNLFEFLEGVE